MKLGALKKVPLREVWKNEAADFSKWLSTKEGLELLSEAVGVDLELMETESHVGKKRVDILAKISGSDQVAIIENQIEDSNHDHLGKLITYAAGKSATCAIWIVKSAADVHRRAIEFLNATSKGSIGYFLLEIEAWKIGDSEPAPKFNVVESPNEWARAESDDSEMTDNARACLSFWTGFAKVAVENDAFNKAGLKVRKPLPQNWTDFSIGHSNIWLTASVSSYHKRATVGVCVGSKYTQRDLILENVPRIARNMGAEIKVGSGDNKTLKIFRKFDLADEASWNSIYDWICVNLAKCKGVVEDLLADAE